MLQQLGVNMHSGELVAETTAALMACATRWQGYSGVGPWRGMACELQGCGRSSELLEQGCSAYAVAMACLCSCVASLRLPVAGASRPNQRPVQNIKMGLRALAAAASRLSSVVGVWK